MRDRSGTAAASPVVVRPRCVLMVNAHGADLAFGGAERHVADLATGLVARGWAVSLLAAFPQKEPQPGLETHTLHDVDWRESQARRLRNQVDDLRSAPSRRLVEVVEAARPDIVHTHNLFGIGTGIWEVCRRLGIPVVHTGHDYYLRCRRATLRRRDGSACCGTPALCAVRRTRLARWSPGVRCLIAVSRAVADRLAPSLQDVPVEIVHNPVRPVADRALRPPRDRLAVLGYMGSLAPEKGIPELIAAARALTGDGVRVRIAGGGRLTPEVEAAAREGLVDYAGYVGGEDRLEFIESCDAGIVPSLWDEPYPLVAVEWIVAGRPVLLADRGGLPEIAAQYSGATLIEPTADAVADGVRRLAAPAAWAEAVGLASSGAIGDEGPAWLDRHERIYADVLEGAGPPR